MGSNEKNAYAELKRIYRENGDRFEAALDDASDDKRRRDAIFRQRVRECEAIMEFCQELTLEGDDQEFWLREANRWMGRKRELEEREEDDQDDDDDEDEDLPLPDQEEGSDGEMRDIEYY